jgi:hypothetical protein
VLITAEIEVVPRILAVGITSAKEMIEMVTPAGVAAKGVVAKLAVAYLASVRLAIRMV